MLHFFVQYSSRGNHWLLLVDKGVRIVQGTRLPEGSELLSFILLGLALFVYNWGVLDYKGYLVRLGLPYPLCLGSGQAESVLLLGGVKFLGFGLGDQGFICLWLLCLFFGGGSSVLPSFQGLEVGSYSNHRVVGGGQSLETFGGISLIYFLSMSLAS